MAPNPMQFLMNVIRNSPNLVANNPQAQAYLEVLESGDAAKGEEIATNLLKSHGVSKDDALKQAKNFFNPMLGHNRPL